MSGKQQGSHRNNDWSSAELRDLAARASTIDERLSGGYIAIDSADARDVALRRLDAWCRSAAASDLDVFRDLLRRDGLDMEEIRPFLGDVRLEESSPVPAWINTFRWSFAALLSYSDGSESDEILCPQEPLPFEHLLAPLVATARAQRDRLHGLDRDLRNERANSALSFLLLERLSELCAPSLLEDFRIFKGEPLLGELLGLPTTGDPKSSATYQRYLSALRGGALKTFFWSRPVMARLVAMMVEQWIDSTSVLMLRLSTDAEAIFDAFNAGQDPGPIRDINCRLSDRHNSGRTVCQITFADGLVIGYKPRTLQMDDAWRALIDWIATRGGPASARAPKVIQRHGYGWVEWVEPRSCVDTREAREFFLRAGAMLCLLQTLRGTDFHYENILACGPEPVPVDLETLLHPQFSEPNALGRSETSMFVAQRHLRDSVLATGYLPGWVVFPGERFFGVGGLNEAGPTGAFHRQIVDINTDVMRRERFPVPSEQRSSLPMLDGQALSSSAYHTDVASGYEGMYSFLMANRSELLDVNGPLAAFRGQTIRVVVRSTALYAMLLSRSLQLHNLGCGVDWCIHFYFLFRFSEPDEVLGHSLQAVERKALQQLDIPYFTTTSDSRDLRFGNGAVVEGAFDRSSFEDLERQLTWLSEERMRRELGTITKSLMSSNANRSGRDSIPWRPHRQDTASTSGLPTRRVLAHVRSFVDLLAREATRVGAGTTWIGTVPLPGSDRVQLKTVEADLYSGNAGIGLFLAAAYHITHDPRDRDLAIAALRPIRDAVRDRRNGPRLARRIGIGGATGLSSLAYCLFRAGGFLGDSSIREDARQTAALITNDAIAAERALDVTDGCAGTVLSLLALYREYADDTMLERALACGRRLLAASVDCKEGGRAWRTSDDLLLTGFSHGAAGITLALFRLYRSSGDVAFLAAARDAIAYERAVYSPVARNWPDLRGLAYADKQAGYPCNWCHGATGIGMARLGSLDILDDANIRAEVAAALATTIDTPIAPSDHLCCGNFGRLEFLFTAGERLGRTDLMGLARGRAQQLLSNARARGSFGWPSGGEDRYNPGFFNGLSGVGYTLLRMTYPDVFPSVLLWE